MNHDEMLSEIDRLNSVCSKPMGEQETQRRTAFLSELERKFLWLTLAQWREVMTWVIDHHKTRALPTLEEFGRGVLALRSAGRIQGYRDCETCLGSTLVYGRFRRISTGEIFSAMTPCPTCRSNARMDLKPDLEVFDDGLTHKQRMAHALTPKQAQVALDLCTFDQDITNILIERSTQPDDDEVATFSTNPLPSNTDLVADRMKSVIANKQTEQSMLTPKRAPPKAEWIQPTVGAQ